MSTISARVVPTARWLTTGLFIGCAVAAVFLPAQEAPGQGSSSIGPFLVVVATLVGVATVGVWRYRLEVTNDVVLKRTFVRTREFNVSELTGVDIRPSRYGGNVVWMSRGDGRLPTILVDLQWWDHGIPLRDFFERLRERTGGVSGHRPGVHDGQEVAIDRAGYLAAPQGPPVETTAGAPPGSGWFGDPTHRHQLRWFDGHEWAVLVRDGEITDTDPY